MELAQLRQTHSDMLGELDKHKKLLTIQQSIADQCKKEVNMASIIMVNIISVSFTGSDDKQEDGIYSTRLWYETEGDYQNGGHQDQ